MKVTKSQKISMGVLGVAVMAFIVDRTFFSPGTAGAAPTPAADVTDATAPVASALVPASATSGAGSEIRLPNEELISDRLKAIGGVDLNGVRDAFAPPRQWVAAQHPVAVRQERNPAAEFTAAHRLNAVMASRGGGEAIVDGQLLHVGQRLGEFQLVAIDRQSAVFVAGNLKATLVLPSTR